MIRNPLLPMHRPILARSRILNSLIPTSQIQQSRTRLHALLAEPSDKRINGLQVRQEEDSDETELLVYDVIDPFFGVSAAAFANALGSVKGKALNVRVNSPGGDVFEGRAIANLIRAWNGPTKVTVDGLAASAASTIAVAAKETVMASGSFMMVHNSWAFAMGNSGELIDLAALLDKIDIEIAADYAAKAGVSDAKARGWMADETWFNAEEAVDVGLANSKIDIKAQMRAFNLGSFRNVPKDITSAPATSVVDDKTSAQQWAANQRRLRLLG